MAQPEAAFKRKIQRRMKAVLEARQMPAKLTWNGGSPFGTPRLDCDGIIGGWPVAIEVKAPGGTHPLTARQKLDMDEYRKAGAKVFLIDSERSLDEFIAWLTLVPQRFDI